MTLVPVAVSSDWVSLEADLSTKELSVTQTQVRQSKHISPAQAPDPLRVWLALGLVLLGVGAAAVAVLGPLVAGAIRYHVSEGAANQVMGGDVAGLVLVAPVSLVAAFLVWRGHRAGRVLALGPALYALYMYLQLGVGGEVFRYPGNSELFFPLFLALFILAGAIVIFSWRSVGGRSLPEPSNGVRRLFGWFALVVALFLTVGLHLRGLVDAWSAQPTGSEYLADPTLFWLVKFMDLGLVVPALAAVGIGSLRRRPWAGPAIYAAAGWMALLGSSVAGMAIVMQMKGDPAASIANTVAFSLFALLGLVVAALVYTGLADRREKESYEHSD